jgi:O-antigen/teichoic acid export membrane protein
VLTPTYLMEASAKMTAEQSRKGSIYREVLRNCGQYSVAVVANRVVGVLLLPVYSRLLTPADYGVMALLDLTLYVASALFGMQLANATFYFCAKRPGDRNRDVVLTTVMAASALLGVFVGALGLLLAESASALIGGSARYATLYQLQFVSLALSLPLEAGYCAIRALDRPGQYVRTALVQLFFAVALTLPLLIHYRLGVAGMISATAAAQVVALVMIICQTRAHLHSIPDGRLLVAMLKYSWPLTISSALMLIVHFGDTFVLRHFVPLAQVGIYSLAYRIGMMVAFVELPYLRYWNVRMYEVVREVGGLEVFSRMCTYRTAALSLAAVALAVFAGPALRIALPTSYYDAAQYVPWIAGAYVVRSVGSHFLDVLLIEGRTSRHLVIIAAGTAVCVGGYVVLIPRFALYGAVFATIVCFATMMVMAYSAARRGDRFRFEIVRLIKIGASAIVVMVSYAYCRPVALSWLVGSAIVFTAAYPALLVLVGLFTPSELRSIRSYGAGFLRA